MYREWAPGAAEAELIGDFNNWQGQAMQRDEFGTWSITLPDGAAGAGATEWGKGGAGRGGAGRGRAGQGGRGKLSLSTDLCCGESLIVVRVRSVLRVFVGAP